ncbi:MAG: hypothetical protein QOE01_3133 [Actinomycetota bacterium]|jgi:hypothetical protein|nr:hypothetical protein [Actinomycetota bacterium]
MRGQLPDEHPEADSQVYAYAVVPVDSADAQTGRNSTLVGSPSRGVAGEPMSYICAGALAMALGIVPTGEFAPAPLSRRLRDPQQAAELASAHFAAVDALFAGGDLLPLRMCTMFTDVAAARSALETNHSSLAEALQRVSRCAQWQLTIESGPREHQLASTVATSGADYLRRVGERQRARESDAVQAASLATTLQERVRPIVRAAQRDSATRTTYLVPRSNTERFLNEVDVDRGAGATIVVGGPWAPYSFVPRVGTP